MSGSGLIAQLAQASFQAVKVLAVEALRVQRTIHGAYLQHGPKKEEGGGYPSHKRPTKGARPG